MIVQARVAPKRDTTARWERKPDFVPFRGEIIIYTDKYSYTNEKGETVSVPAIKIGDGTTCIAELPFLGTGSTPVPVYYADLQGKPRIGGKELVGDMSLEELGIQEVGDYPEVPLSADDIDKIIDEADEEDTENS